jgi:hypothetical protein
VTTPATSFNGTSALARGDRDERGAALTTHARTVVAGLIRHIRAYSER